MTGVEPCDNRGGVATSEKRPRTPCFYFCLLNCTRRPIFLNLSRNKNMLCVRMLNFASHHIANQSMKCKSSLLPDDQISSESTKYNFTLLHPEPIRFSLIQLIFPPFFSIKTLSPNYVERGRNTIRASA